MPSFRTGTVTTIRSERAGLQRVDVDGRPAYVLTQLVGPVAVGDRVVVNTTAVELDLGTGGWDVVHWNLANDSLDLPGGGHVMKLRYTSLQADTGVAEEHGRNPESLRGKPVVALALHSQLATAAAAVKLLRPEAKVSYVMTDAASLPIALSDLVAALRGAALLDETLTVGHAFGGDVEAVNVASGLALATGDVIMVGMGLGSVGTGTALGYGGYEVGAILDTIHDLGGVGIAALRYSDADKRERHRGVSHHSATALGAAHAPVVVAIPADEPAPAMPPNVATAMVSIPDAIGLLNSKGIEVRTMGRGPDDDPRAFAYAAAAGAYAAAHIGR